MIDVFASIISSIFSIFKIPLIIFLSLILLLVVLVIFNCFLLYFKGIRIKKSVSRTMTKKRGILKRIFVDFTKRYAKDIMTADYDRFPYKGIVVFTGRQGNGKTIAMTEFIKRMSSEYELSKVITNFDLSVEDDVLVHWKQLVDYSNDKYGVIVGMDEMQNWLGTFLSRNFPPEMLGVATQNRKNSRIICGTSQSFHLLAKSIRSQCTEVRECKTFFGCLTVVRRREPVLDSEGDVVKYINRGYYFFVHSDELRNSYDTYKVISSLSEQVNNVLDKE